MNNNIIQLLDHNWQFHAEGEEQCTEMVTAPSPRPPPTAQSPHPPRAPPAPPSETSHPPPRPSATCTRAAAAPPDPGRARGSSA